MNLDLQRAMLYGAPDASLGRVIQNNISRGLERVSHAGAEVKNFFTEAYQTFNQLHGEDTIRNIRMLSRQVGSVWDEDKIRLLNTIGQYQNPGTQMMNFIMAEPTIRQRFYDGRCAWYDEKYIDPEPGMVGEDQGLFRVLNNGLTQHVPEHGDHEYFVTYLDDFVDASDELDIVEVSHIKSTQHNLMLAMFDEEEDPTSPANSML